MIKFLLLLFCVFCVFSSKGFAVLDYEKSETFQCLQSKGYSFALKMIQEEHQPIVKIIDDLTMSRNVNVISDILYITDISKKSSYFIENILTNIPSNLYGMIWLIFDNAESNSCFYLQQIVQKVKSYGKKVGISTNSNQWYSLMGNGCLQVGKQPLMYTSQDNEQNFNNFVPFGGWQKPTMKWYEIEHSDCNIYIVKIYSP